MHLTKSLASTLPVFLFSCASVSRPSLTKTTSPQPSHCYANDVRTMLLPVYPGTKNSPKFNYRFKYFDAGDSTKPIIIFLPGGPGYPSMDESLSTGIPAGYRYILTDQRGTGCNNLPDSQLPADSLTSDNMAEDVVSFVKSLHLDNYIIYGHSFGTIHATKVVAKIENEFRSISRDRGLTSTDIQLPKAVVLEGTIGKAFANGNGYKASADEWENIKVRLPKDVVQQLSQTPLPFDNLITGGSAPSNWGTYINGMLNLGQFPPVSGFGDLSYSLLSLQQAYSNPVNYNTLAQRVAGSAYQGYFDIFLQIDCAELYDSFQGELKLENGKLIAAGPNLCANYTFRPYDSAEFHISTPIYYFQGESDPATPVWQARYHFKGHGAASRKFIQLQGIGHTPLQRSLTHCKASLWEAIVQGGDTLLEKLKQCPGVKSVSSDNVEANASELQVKWNWN